MFDRECSHYNIKVKRFASAEGRLKHFKTEKAYTEEEAVKIARDYHKKGYHVTVEDVQFVVGWWEI